MRWSLLFQAFAKSENAGGPVIDGCECDFAVIVDGRKSAESVEIPGRVSTA